MQNQSTAVRAFAQEATGICGPEPTWRLPIDWPVADLCDFHPYLTPVEPACEQLAEPLLCPICGTPVRWVVCSTKRQVLGYIRILQRWITETERR
jgi:hypothetical protein